MCDIPLPDISPDFTIEDIHRIREWNHERHANMTHQEIADDYRKTADLALAKMKELRESKAASKNAL